MESLYNKEKKLETVLEKLKNLGNLPITNTQELEQIYAEKNQLQSEKIELENKYNDLVSKYNELKNQIKKWKRNRKKLNACRNSSIKILRS